MWLEKHNKWKIELDKLKIISEAHDKTCIAYLENGISILELATDAYSIYKRQDPMEKGNFLKTILLNCFLKDGKLDYTYKVPFDILAKGLSLEKTSG